MCEGIFLAEAIQNALKSTVTFATFVQSNSHGVLILLHIKKPDCKCDYCRNTFSKQDRLKIHVRAQFKCNFFVANIFYGLPVKLKSLS